MDGVITRDPGILSGRWRFANTTIPVAEMLLDHREWVPHGDEEYSFLNLTADQIAQGLDFQFPALFKHTVSMLYSSFTIGCVCGEETAVTLTGFQEIEVHCICRRDWTVALSIWPSHLEVRVAPDGMAVVGESAD